MIPSRARANSGTYNDRMTTINNTKHVTVHFLDYHANPLDEHAVLLNRAGYDALMKILTPEQSEYIYKLATTGFYSAHAVRATTDPDAQPA